MNTLNLVMIADDLTGSFDTGVQFDKRGASVGFAVLDQLDACPADTDVVVIDTESRHDAPSLAYDKVARAARWAKAHGAQHLYVKTDSGLRGNVGPSIKAVLDVMGCKAAAFAPAYPDMKRVTVGGRQLIDGVPIHKSVFGRDPFDPVKVETVRELIEPCGLPVKELGLNKSWDTDVTEPTALVFDAQQNEDFLAIARHLKANGQLTVTAGCAAFAAQLQPYLGLPDTPRQAPALTAPLMVVCGSVNPITRLQVLFGERQGYARRVVDPRKLTDDVFWQGEAGKEWRAALREVIAQRRTLLVDTGLAPIDPGPMGLTALREGIAARLGWLVKEMAAWPESAGYTPMIIGGDTLMGFLTLLEKPQVRLEGESAPGVVIFSVNMEGRRMRLLSKSGGFGSESLLKDISDSMISM